MIWDINPFDQWGVELGKKIADKMTLALAGQKDVVFDASTMHLLDIISKANQEVSS